MPRNFDSELQLINTGLVYSPVSFSGRGEKLLERNKRLEAIRYVATV